MSHMQMHSFFHTFIVSGNMTKSKYNFLGEFQSKRKGMNDIIEKFTTRKMKCFLPEFFWICFLLSIHIYSWVALNPKCLLSKIYSAVVRWFTEIDNSRINFDFLSFFYCNEKHVNTNISQLCHVFFANFPSSDSLRHKQK